MLSHELLDLFRTDTVDDVEPYLWCTAEVYQYMNDAYFMFTRLTGGISDGSSAVTQLAAVTGVATTEIDESIMRVRTARNSTSNRPITIINVQDTDELSTEDYGILHKIWSSDVPGRPEYMVIGEEEGYVRWIRVPNANYTIQLVVDRLPLIPITRSKQPFTGVRSEHHFHLLKWMRHLAYRKQDADSFNLVKSDQERNDFFDYCTLANEEKDRRKHKVRTTSYGGL